MKVEHLFYCKTFQRHDEAKLEEYQPGTCDTTIGIFRSDCSYVIICLLTDNTRKATENLAS